MSSGAETAVPLFPLQTVLFPDGLLPLKIFEARYLDMVSDCLRSGTGFGVVCLNEGAEVRHAGQPVRFEQAGTLVRLDHVDAAQPGILQLRCMGTQRFRCVAPPVQQADGLWTARVRTLPGDPPLPLPPALEPSARALSGAIDALRQQGVVPFAAPYRQEEAGWVANRWCEILPLPLPAKQKLMLLDDPVMRLELVDDFLRQRGVVTG